MPKSISQFVKKKQEQQKSHLIQARIDWVRWRQLYSSDSIAQVALINYCQSCIDSKNNPPWFDQHALDLIIASFITKHKSCIIAKFSDKAPFTYFLSVDGYLIRYSSKINHGSFNNTIPSDLISKPVPFPPKSFSILPVDACNLLKLVVKQFDKFKHLTVYA